MNLFTTNLQSLFELKSKELGREYTEIEVEAKAKSLGFNITSTYIIRLRKGGSANPTYDKIKALAQIFDVDPNWFFEDHSSLGEARISGLAMRATAEPTMNDLMKMIESVKEQLDELKRNDSSIEKDVSEPKTESPTNQK